MPKGHYIARYMCSLDEPDATRTWFLFDREIGTPVFDDRGVRLFTRPEIDEILKSGNSGPPGEAPLPG